MENYQKFWLLFWLIVAAAAVLIVACVANYYTNQRKDLIAAGYSYIDGYTVTSHWERR